jgi:hypothetical protein
MIGGSNGRHGVDAEVEVDVAVGSETVEIAVDAIPDQTPSDKRRFATPSEPAFPGCRGLQLC